MVEGNARGHVQRLHEQLGLEVPEVLAEVRRRLDQAVVKRLMSDVPVGVYLPGGLDSSLVAALMRPHTVNLHSFTAGMAGAPDLEAARAVARYLGRILADQ